MFKPIIFIQTFMDKNNIIKVFDLDQDEKSFNVKIDNNPFATMNIGSKAVENIEKNLSECLENIKKFKTKYFKPK